MQKLSMKKLGMKKLNLRAAHTKAKKRKRRKVPGTNYQKIPGTSYSYFKKGPTRRIGKPRAKIKEIGRVGTHLR